MSNEKDLLIEIGTEELPPKALKGLAVAFSRELAAGLKDQHVNFDRVSYYATPRRLGLVVQHLTERQEDQFIERKGPALNVAFDKAGTPTRAALGFARSCGVDVTELDKLEKGAGGWIVYRSTKVGIAVEALLPQIIEQALGKLPVPKRMRWGSAETEFVRPIHWIILLFGHQIVKTPILGVMPDRKTYGHRFHHPQPIEIPEPGSYVKRLESFGHVIADFKTRRHLIEQQVDALARQLGGHAMMNEALLDEVTALVEWPVSLAGSYPKEYLNIPPEVLISTMQDHQKYFPVIQDTGQLLPHFIAISNIESKDPQKIREGNERVIRPRFSDAEFFWQQDCKSTLANRREALKGIVFQGKLGTLFDKSERLITLTEAVAGSAGIDVAPAQRAAALCKCDLVTNMVTEFPGLQGVMGRYYAQRDGEPSEVATALDEQYMPRHAGGALPNTGVGQCLAIADRLDTLVGIFAIGQKPTGVKDPFGLRRAALGILRIIIERERDLDLERLLASAAANFPPELGANKAVPVVFDYVMDRLKAYYDDRHVGADVIDAVMARRPTRPLDFDRRLHAVERFRRLPHANNLATAHKRIHNILKQANAGISATVDKHLLEHTAERELYQHLSKMSDDVDPLFEQGNYEQGLTKLAALREPVDRFFDEVMVMVEDAALKTNRVALLNRLHQLFMRTADLSRLQY
jgi:glycyl-tRNA synthetase beta chain